LNFLGSRASQQTRFDFIDTMKKLLILLTLFTSLATLPPIAEAKDKDKDRDRDRDKWEDRDKKRWKELRDDVRETVESHGRLVDSAKVAGVSRRTWDDVNHLGMDVRRASDEFERGRYNYDEMFNRVRRIQSAINRTRDQIKYEQQSRRGGGYYRYR
jgi:hypothetical protein